MEKRVKSWIDVLAISLKYRTFKLGYQAEGSIVEKGPYEYPRRATSWDEGGLGVSKTQKDRDPSFKQ